MTVHLVGAGPGAPDLISVRAARLLGQADVVLHDRLARPLLALAPASAEVVDVGKAPGAAPVPQEEINRLLVEYGRRHRCVVRLKGGDPFVFARGSEEAAALMAAGIDFSVVPGISSVLAAPVAGGSPLTHRGLARSFTVITGHAGPADWPPGFAEALATIGGTIVVVMGAASIGRIASRLVEVGLVPQTPVLGVRAATGDAEEVRRATLATVGELGLGSPSVFVIGDVAGLDLRSIAPPAPEFGG
ncbi:MAG: uroporphyrinogen-III C-methyltransferase [Acidimicrobiia bacterium]|nr:uroporphyrinogen-III C-methyltransferase [Acidimicrobiia bacterium]